MKIAPYLAQYLYNNEELSLEGIGVLKMNADAISAETAENKINPEDISFESNKQAKQDTGLIAFIAEQTGKMKTLAAADVDSYLELAKQFLNIGKPFLIEGIGTLTKNQIGNFEFTSELSLAERIKEAGKKELSATSTSTESFTTYENLKPKKEKGSPAKKIILALLILTTISAVIFGGYKMSQKENTETADNANNEDTKKEIIPVENKTTTEVPKDTVTQQVPVQTTPAPAVTGNGEYNFVIEVADSNRAYKRYSDMKNWGHDVHIAPLQNASSYKIFFTLAVNPSDTAHICDSLSLNYPAMNRQRAFVETK